MPIYPLNENQRQQLLGQAEYGMGYQLTRDRSYVFLNAEIAINLVDGELRADVGWLNEFLPQEGANQAMLDGLPGYNGGLEVATHGSYRSTTLANETFWRYSAFRRDRRILAGGSVMSGTYATTQNDSTLVTSGLGAVGRYALPNPTPARYVHTLHPPTGEVIMCGNSAPLFGQAGGGVEILVTRRLPPNSARSATPIAER